MVWGTEGGAIGRPHAYLMKEGFVGTGSRGGGSGVRSALVAVRTQLIPLPFLRRRSLAGYLPSV